MPRPSTSQRRLRLLTAFFLLTLLLLCWLRGSPVKISDHGGWSETHRNAPTDTSPVPSDALVVSPTGSDGGPGTVARPMRSIEAAVRRAQEGQTIALREGVWHEMVHVGVAPRVHLRSWPNEEVWLDGTTELTGFTPDSSTWRLDGYGVDLDVSPTFTRGAPDNTEPGWRFVDPAAPMAADPQQVWLDDEPLRQVSQLSEVGPGKFFVDRTRRALYIGSDPSDHRVSAGVLRKALTITAAGVTVSGIGIRRYVPSLPDFGAVTVGAPDANLRNVLVVDSSTIGVSVQSQRATLTRVEIIGTGMLGLHASRADDLRLLDVAVTNSNTERFNMAPTAGGAKITASRRLRVEGGSYSNNHSSGIWLDESVVDAVIDNVDTNYNALHGIHVELSSGVTVFSVSAKDNAGNGIRIQGSDRIRIWNSTFMGNRRQVDFVQDGRRPNDADAQRSLPEGSTGRPTWVLGSSEVVNSVMDQGGGAGDSLFAVEDFTRKLNASDLDIRLHSNVYVMAERPRWSHVWSRAQADPAVFNSPAAFASATAAEQGSWTIDRLEGTDAQQTLTHANALPIPPDLGVGRVVKSQGIGAIR